MAVLLMAPGVIVLDEPFAGLDMATALRLSRYLDALDAALPKVGPRPLDLLRLRGKERQRASPQRKRSSATGRWQWGDEE